jgi:hypothetical protein
MSVAPPVALIGFGLVTYAYFALIMAHVVSDFARTDGAKSRLARAALVRIVSPSLWERLSCSSSASASLSSSSRMEESRQHHLYPLLFESRLRFLDCRLRDVFMCRRR